MSVTEERKNMRVVNHAVPKVDAEALVTGKAVYTNDLAPADCLIVKIIRSPHAHALIKEINTARAEAVPGIECILTYKDCPDKRFTMAGQTYPEPSPYDRLILDQRMRFVGDAAAIVAGTSEEAVKKAMKLVKIKYEVLEPVLDFRKAKDNPILVHPEDNWKSLCPVGADNKRNLCAHDVSESGDIEAVLEECDYVIDRIYHTKANQQAMMETFRTYSYLDTYGRLNVVSLRRSRSMCVVSWPMHWISRRAGCALSNRVSAEVLVRNRHQYRKSIRHLSHGRQENRPKLSIREKNH